MAERGQADALGTDRANIVYGCLLYHTLQNNREELADEHCVNLATHFLAGRKRRRKKTKEEAEEEEEEK